MDWITTDNAKRGLIIAGFIVSLSGTLGFQIGSQGKEQAVERIIIIKDLQLAGVATAYSETCK